MKKNWNLCVDLQTMLQKETMLTEDLPYKGILTRTGEDQYLFQEAVQHERRPRRNPKLYEGKYVSLVRMSNGRYQCHLRTMYNLEHTDSRALAFSVFTELMEALEIVG